MAVLLTLLMAQQGNGLGPGPRGQLLHLLDLVLHLFQVSLSGLGERDLPFVSLLQELHAGPQVLAPLVYQVLGDASGPLAHDQDAGAVIGLFVVVIDGFGFDRQLSCNR